MVLTPRAPGPGFALDGGLRRREDTLTREPRCGARCARPRA